MVLIYPLHGSFELKGTSSPLRTTETFHPSILTKGLTPQRLAHGEIWHHSRRSEAWLASKVSATGTVTPFAALHIHVDLQPPPSSQHHQSPPHSFLRTPSRITSQQPKATCSSKTLHQPLEQLSSAPPAASPRHFLFSSFPFYLGSSPQPVAMEIPNYKPSLASLSPRNWSLEASFFL